MAQIIKHRRGSIQNIGSISFNAGELVIGSGSIGTLNGPVAFIGDPASSAYRPVPQIYSGSTAPTVTSSYFNGISFYATSDKNLYILQSGSNLRLDLAGGVSGSPITPSSITTAGNISSSNVFASNNITATSISASYAFLSVASGSFSGSFTGSFVGTASYATSASYAFNSTTASYAATATSGAYAVNATSASFASTASYVNTLFQTVTITGSINAQTASIGTLTTTGNVTIGGNLTVNGGTTIVSSSVVDIGTSTILLNYNAAANQAAGIYAIDNTAPTLGTGSLLYDPTNNYWTAGLSGSEQRVARQASGTQLTAYALTYTDVASGSLVSLPTPTTPTATVGDAFPVFVTGSNTWYMTNTIDGGTF
jgi:hypothetical protein